MSVKSSNVLHESGHAFLSFHKALRRNETGGFEPFDII